LNNNRQIMTDHILQFDRTFATRHNLTVLAGFNFTRNTFFNLNGAGQRSATDYLFTFSGDPISTIINGVVQPNQSVASTLTETKTASYFGQVNYDFDGKYLLGRHPALRRFFQLCAQQPVRALSVAVGGLERTPRKLLESQVREPV
jgi:outer membrane receptor protein involved in Fe transport